MEKLTIIILSLIIIIIILVISIYVYFRNKVRAISRQVFNTDSILEGLKKEELEYQETPKSVSGLDSVLISKINKDFPNLDINEMKKTAENAIMLYFKSLERRTLAEIPNASDKLNNHIKHSIEELNKKEDITYSNIIIHKTVINNYTNKKGICKIVFQTSLEFIKETKNETKKVQERYNTEMIYIYDSKDIKDQYGISLNCKNCGGPIKELGTKTCPYCGTGVIDIMSKTWKINDLYRK